MLCESFLNQRLCSRGSAFLALTIFIAAYAPCTHTEEHSTTQPTTSEVMALLQANGTADVAAEIGPLAAQQLSAALRRTNPGLPPRADIIVRETVLEYLRKRAVSDRVVDKLVPIYAKYLTREDIQRITSFYRSPAGRRLVKVLPSISLESAKVGQDWMESILPGLQSELLRRLRREKLIE